MKIKYQKIQKFFCFLLAFCLLIPLLPSQALAVVDADYELYYTDNGGFLRVNRYTGILRDGQNLTGDLVIPSEVEGVKVVAIEEGAFKDCSEITSVTVPPSVTLIGDSAFEYCTGLERVSIAGAASIGTDVFLSCTSLRSVRIAEGTVSLGRDAFMYCYSLREVSLPTTLKSIEDNTFFSCLELQSISIPSGVESIGAYAFHDCKKLTSVTLPDTLTFLGDYCFDECPSLTDINIPRGVKELPTAAFSGCTSLDTLILSDSVQRINGLAFRRCEALRRLSLPDSVTAIKASAFERCGDVTFYVNPGSYAQAFASANKIKYVLHLLEDGQQTPFVDIADHWAKDSVTWAYQQGLFSGTSDTTFSPNVPVTRGMLASVLYRMEGRPDAGTSSFTDVHEGDYYAKAVAWAETTGVVSGVGGNRFAPNQNITREQLSAMLYRYAKYKDKDVSARGDLGRFKDTHLISNYAGTAMAWNVGVGIVSGVGNALLDPRGNATRAQCAVMLKQFAALP